MTPATTKDLFQQVINTRAIYHQLQTTPEAVRQLRVSFKKDKVSLDKMHEVLRLAGYQIVQPTLWEK